MTIQVCGQPCCLQHPTHICAEPPNHVDEHDDHNGHRWLNERTVTRWTITD